MNFGGRGDRSYASNAGVWWGRLRRLLQAGEISLPEDEALAEELTNRTHWMNASGRIVLEDKERMRSRGAPSPDLADALALTHSAYEDVDWDSAYGIVRCSECGTGFDGSDPASRCPRCGGERPS